MFPVHGGKCLSRWNGGAEVADRTFTRLLCCGFRRTGKAVGLKCINVGGGCVEKYIFFSMFYVLYQFVTYLLSLPRIKELCISVTLFLGYDPLKGQRSLHRCSYCFSQCSAPHIPLPNIRPLLSTVCLFSTLKMEAAGFFETLVTIYQTARRYKEPG
jgi:hypothetical protein